MIRFAGGVIAAIVACDLLLAIPMSFADDVADSIGAKLDVARSKYKKDIEQFDLSVKRLLETKETAARKTGDKAAIDSLRAEQEMFQKIGELPSAVPISFEKNPFI